MVNRIFAPAPRDRLTNAGSLVATVEFDWENVAEFDQNVGWFAGKDGDFAGSAFAEVDRQLREHHDYRGFCAVHSGRVSVHTHIIYGTAHLVHAPYGADYQTRLARRPEIAAVMHSAHDIIWRHVVEVMTRVLQPARAPDYRLANAAQWRRAPLGVNELQKDCDFLGLVAGQRVPQLPLCENIRRRRPKGSVEFLVDPHLSPEPSRRLRSRNLATSRVEPRDVPDEALALVRRACEEEWGAAYPRAMKIGFEGGEAVIHFANHANDQNPSSIVRGGFKKLLLLGEKAPAGDFFLPDDYTANEIVSWAIDATGERASDLADPGLTDEERQAIIARTRRKVGISTELHLKWKGCDRLITSPEGAGKSHGILASMYGEMPDSRDGPSQHFMIYAARSTQQADDKRREYEERFHAPAVLLESFWAVYRRVCEGAGVEPLRTLDFDKLTASEVLTKIEGHQPTVFAQIEAYRRNFWRNARYDCGATMIFTTKATVRTWNASRLTRAWLHPSFEPGASPEQEAAFAVNFGHGSVAFDELELDEIIHVWTEPRYALIKAQQEANPRWADLPRHERLGIFSSLRGGRADFEAFDADMRVDLASLERVEVDFKATPFGSDNSDSGIYRRKDKAPFYLGVQDWLFSAVGNRNFLTTERLMTEVVRAAYRKSGDAQRRSRLMCKYVEPPPELFPIEVELFVDRRANARGVTELAREIADANPNAFVICNRVKDNDQVLTFQRAKGANHLADHDVYIIITHLHPDQYALLNTVGQWLDIPDVVGLYYRDQISQAVGRNRGFRDKGNGRKTVVIAPGKLARSSISSSLPTGPSAKEPVAEQSEFRRALSASTELIMADSEFAPRRVMREPVRFLRTKTRPW